MEHYPKEIINPNTGGTINSTDRLSEVQIKQLTPYIADLDTAVGSLPSEERQCYDDSQQSLVDTRDDAPRSAGENYIV